MCVCFLNIHTNITNIDLVNGKLDFFHLPIHFLNPKYCFHGHWVAGARLGHCWAKASDFFLTKNVYWWHFYLTFLPFCVHIDTVLVLRYCLHSRLFKSNCQTSFSMMCVKHVFSLLKNKTFYLYRDFFRARFSLWLHCLPLT